jgi:hypothetical protein
MRPPASGRRLLSLAAEDSGRNDSQSPGLRRFVIGHSWDMYPGRNSLEADLLGSTTEKRKLVVRQVKASSETRFLKSGSGSLGQDCDLASILPSCDTGFHIEMSHL